MNKTRMEAFSDGVIAILITIMVFDIKAPRGSDLEALGRLVPIVLPYLLSFLHLGIYWNNHHHMLLAVRKINGAALWGNLHLLFWLSLLPFTTSWLHISGFESIPTAVYGVVLLLAAVAYSILQRTLIAVNGPDSPLQRAIGYDVKGNLSLSIYIVGIGSSFWNPYIAIGLYTVVAVIWLVPDWRIESQFHASQPDQPAK